MGAFLLQILFIPQFSPKIMTNVLELDQIWQCQHKNGKKITFLPYADIFSPPSSKIFSCPSFVPPNFGAGVATAGIINDPLQNPEFYTSMWHIFKIFQIRNNSGKVWQFGNDLTKKSGLWVYESARYILWRALDIGVHMPDRKTCELGSPFLQQNS